MSTATLEKKLKRVERELKEVKETHPEESLDEYKNAEEIRRAIFKAQR